MPRGTAESKQEQLNLFSAKSKLPSQQHILGELLQDQQEASSWLKHQRREEYRDREELELCRLVLCLIPDS